MYQNKTLGLLIFRSVYPEGMKYFASLVLALLIYSISSSAKGNMDHGVYASTETPVFSVNDMPYGQSFSYWVDKWFNWFLTLPNIQGNESLMHPRDHYSPVKCSWKQDKHMPVWMLADGPDQNDLTTTEIRECQVPEGKALLVQIVGSNCSPNEGYKNDQELLKCAAWVLDKAQFSASIDGKEVMNTNDNPSDRDKFYVEPFVANITYGKNNYYDDPEGTVRGMEAGYFLFIKPLPTGNHTINYKESVINTLDSSGNDKRISNVQSNIVVANNTKLMQ